GRLSWEEAAANPNARKTRMWNIRHPIWYSPHSLGPLLRVLDDRVVKVTAMATRRPSYYLEQVPLPDMEVALMHTAGDTIIRLAAGLIAPSPRPFLWWHLTGTEGQVETSKRGLGGEGLGNAGALLWLADHQMRTPAEVTWGFTDYPARRRPRPRDVPAARSGRPRRARLLSGARLRREHQARPRAVGRHLPG